MEKPAHKKLSLLSLLSFKNHAFAFAFFLAFCFKDNRDNRDNLFSYRNFCFNNNRDNLFSYRNFCFNNNRDNFFLKEIFVLRQ